MDKKPRPYNTLPRFIAEDLLDKKLTRSEWILCVWLRNIADPYGVTTTSAAAIRDDMFPSVQVNTVEKLLLSLKRKGYIRYPNHRGRRGSVRIESDEWLIKGKGVKRLADSKETNEVPNEIQTPMQPDAEPSHNLIEQNHNFNDPKRALVTRFSMGSKYARLTSHHNEHEPDKDKENNTSASFKGTLAKDFDPRSEEERQCRDIAIRLGEEYINPILNILRTNGFWAIERAWEVYENDRNNNKQISNPAAYFQGVIKKIITKR